jgi:hypothetical protein
MIAVKEHGAARDLLMGKEVPGQWSFFRHCTSR